MRGNNGVREEAVEKTTERVEFFFVAMRRIRVTGDGTLAGTENFRLEPKSFKTQSVVVDVDVDAMDWRVEISREEATRLETKDEGAAEVEMKVIVVV